MTDNRTAELLPCPFREHKRKKLVIHHRKCHWYEGGLYAVKCEICGIRGPYALSEEKAVEKWNTRTATTDLEFARAVHDGNLWRRIKGHIRCRNCGLNIESVIALDGCNEHAIKHCPNCGKEV